MGRTIELVVASFAAAWGLGCGYAERSRVRFANEDIVWHVNDRVDVRSKPASRPFDHAAYVFENVVHEPIDDILALPPRDRAANVNALGEVPDSTWFTNRIGLRGLNVDAIARGPNRDAGPAPGPLFVLRTKAGGASPGFLVEDARGVRYVIKFDRPSRPEMETGADVVVQRLLWAAGYNVPENVVIDFAREDLHIGTGAVKELAVGGDAPLVDADLDEVLSEVYRSDAGLYRALASRFLEGEPLGGTPQVGVRRDDPNDRVPHELRRELRGLYVFAAWLAHSDMKEDNSIDMWVEDDCRPGQHFVAHYLLDFGKALGVMAWTNRELFDGYAHNFDYRLALSSMFTLGLVERTWEQRQAPGLRGVGVFESAQFHPARFRSRNRYIPFQRKDRLDAYWATKILMRFSPEHIAAAVNQGSYTEPAAVEYLTRVLLERQLATGRYWLAKTNPIDAFKVEPQAGSYRLCARDLLLWYGLQPEAGAVTHYVLKSYDFHGRSSEWQQRLAARHDGVICVDGVPASGGADRYTIVSFYTVRGRKAMAPLWVHLAADPENGHLRVIGVERG